jgi:hypothetical protein
MVAFRRGASGQGGGLFNGSNMTGSATSNSSNGSNIGGGNSFFADTSDETDMFLPLHQDRGGPDLLPPPNRAFKSYGGGLTTKEVLHSLANRILHSTFYKWLYLLMALLSVVCLITVRVWFLVIVAWCMLYILTHLQHHI